MSVMTLDDQRSQMSSPKVEILIDRCAGCQECVIRCPVGALGMDPVTWTALADSELCVGCRQCVRTCPFSAITVDGPMVLEPRVEISVRHPQHLAGSLSETRPGIASWDDALKEASRCLSCPDPTCVRGCPAHNDIPGFIAAISHGDLDEAHAVLARTTFLPDVCSRVCDQAIQCEGACSWSLAGGIPVAIGALERFVADNAPIPPLEQIGDGGKGLKVAVVGSGPAGIGAAWTLCQAGAQVSVFEKDAEPGGLLRWGIPDFTLPKAVERRCWDDLVSAGVQLRLGEEVRPDKLGELLEHHDAVVLANGAGNPIRLPVKGGDTETIWDATRFLTSAREALAAGQSMVELLGQPQAPSSQEPPVVLVVGGGNTAMDVARLSRRLGAKAVCVDWMDRRFAPVRPDELEEAEAEGVEIRFSTTLASLEAGGDRPITAHLDGTRQDNPGELPKVVIHDVDALGVDLVVMAMGYRLDPSFAPLSPASPVYRRALSGIADRRWEASGILAVSAPEYARHQPVGRLSMGREEARVRAGLPAAERVWVAGDALVGPATVVEAMAQGRAAAHALLSDRRIARGPSSDQGARGALRVLVAYESRGGNTERVAKRIAELINIAAAKVTVAKLEQVHSADIAQADLVVVGTWVEGFVVAGVHVAARTRRWAAQLPWLGEKPLATFCTYGVSPKRALLELRETLESHGAKVVAEASFGPAATRRADKAPAVETFANTLLGMHDPNRMGGVRRIPR